MTNSVSQISSSPWTGLGTQTYTVVTAGTYTCQMYCSIPWDRSNTTAALANPTSMEIQTVTTTADVAGSLNSTFWTFHTAGNTTGYYVWYNINSAGVDPAPAGLTGIAVAGATGVTANNLATATRTAINAVTGTGAGGAGTLTATGATNVVQLNATQVGTSTAAADGTAATSFAFAVTAAGSYGTLQSGLNLQIRKNSTVLFTTANPSQSQPSMGGTVTTSASVGDTITVVAASLAPADQAPNAIHGIMNVFLGNP